MDIALLVIAALIVAVIGATVAVVAVVNRNQQRAITRDSRLIPGQPTAAPGPGRGRMTPKHVCIADCGTR